MLVPVAFLSTVTAVLSRRERRLPWLPHLSRLIVLLRVSNVWIITVMTMTRGRLDIVLHHFVVARGRSQFPKTRILELPRWDS